jgi:hypothetical protein
MQSIFDTLKTGTGKERLGLVADIVSILGVSFATVLGGAFALGSKLDVENTMGVLIGGLLSLAGASVVFALFLAASLWLGLHLPENSLIRRLILIALWFTFGALFLYAAYFAYAVLTSVRFLQP